MRPRAFERSLEIKSQHSDRSSTSSVGPRLPPESAVANHKYRSARRHLDGLPDSSSPNILQRSRTSRKIALCIERRTALRCFKRSKIEVSRRPSGESGATRRKLLLSTQNGIGNEKRARDRPSCYTKLATLKSGRLSDVILDLRRSLQYPNNCSNTDVHLAGYLLDREPCSLWPCHFISNLARLRR
jgi:hypothetical protein